MKITKVLALTLATVLVCSLFAGCSLFGGKTILKFGDNNISEAVYEGGIGYISMSFMQSYGIQLSQMLGEEFSDGVTGAEFLKEQVDGFFIEGEAINALAKENGISLTKEEKQLITESKKQTIEQSGGKKAFLEQIGQSGINEAFYDYFVLSQQLYLKLYQELFTGEGKFAPTPEAVADEAINNGYIRVKHILVMAEEGDEDFAEKKAKAEDIAKRAKNGEDFEALLSEFGEDPGMTSNPDGYIIDKDGYTPDGSMMVKEFTDASNALSENGVSGIVASDYGFHIIKRYPFGKDYIIENSAKYSYIADTKIASQKVAEKAQTIQPEKTAAYEKLDLYKILGVEKKLGEGVNVEEHSEDDGHDHGAEAAE
ncbi:MAG: peptidylprolyl isomerase [Oscillospiraceae bacterium]|nr:peptidylprolyl isomerase [Oscillospiraceae bacterium]